MNLAILIILAVVAIVDLWLVFTKRPTISHRYQALAPTSLDIVILVAVLIIIFNLPVDMKLKIVLGALAGHVFWPNRECYR